MMRRTDIVPGRLVWCNVGSAGEPRRACVVLAAQLLAPYGSKRRSLQVSLIDVTSGNELPKRRTPASLHACGHGMWGGAGSALVDERQVEGRCGKCDELARRFECVDECNAITPGTDWQRAEHVRGHIRGGGHRSE